MYLFSKILVSDTTTTDAATTSTVATTTDGSYRWRRPKAWNSERLYNWGSSQGDEDLLDADEHWTKYYRCKAVSLNGKAGAVFFYKRHHVIHVSSTSVLVKLTH